MCSCTRFAPSPTGYLHRGHVLSALWVFGIAESLKLKAVLRIEDHDQTRCREPYVHAIQEDLNWLGFRWQQYCRQSHHNLRYLEVLNAWIRLGWVYPCTCTRQQLQGDSPYPGTCRGQSMPTTTFWGPTRQDQGFSLRLNLSLAIRSMGHTLKDYGHISWNDFRTGQVYQDDAYATWGDPVLLDRYGQWTYQFAVVVDDLAEQVDLVIRGEDILNSTARQLLLRKILCASMHVPNIPIHFFHHQLLTDLQGRKLSKRQFDRSIRAERDSGISPQELLGQVFFQAGLAVEQSPKTIEQCFALLKNYFTKS